MAVGRFQPFTQGHLNMVNEGEGPCIIYQMKPNELPSDLKTWKVGTKKVKLENIKNVVEYINSKGETEINELEKEMMKRPFTNELVNKELEIVKKNNSNIIDIVYVRDAFQAYAMFNKFILDHKDEWEPQYWMCGDDRKAQYQAILDKGYDKLAIEKDGEEFENVCTGIELNLGKGRTEGISGTAVRKSIITDDKVKFGQLMPQGVSSMFVEFKDAFNQFKDKLEGAIKEGFSMTSLKNYIYEHLNA